MAATLEGLSGPGVAGGDPPVRGGHLRFFTSGWPKFVQDQALPELEFLVFRYDCDTRASAPWCSARRDASGRT
jgi:hypothetical protein